MKITIIQDDGVVGVDRVFRKVDLNDLDPAIHAIQWDGVKGCGHIEFDDDLDPRRENETLTDFSAFQVFVDRWSAAAPPPRAPTPEQLAAADLERKRAEALRALDDARLAQAVLDPLAPPEVTDYAAAIK